MSEWIRHENDGIRKLCGCPRRTWSKCPHPWHFNFKWNGEHFRFSLARRVGMLVRREDGSWHRERATLGQPISSKSEAEHEAERLRTGIRDGSLLKGSSDRPVLDTLRLGELLDRYFRDCLIPKRAEGVPEGLRAEFRAAIERRDWAFVDKHLTASLLNGKYEVAAIRRTVVPLPTGDARAFADWFVKDISPAALEDFRKVRLTVGRVTANRQLALLRACFNWAILRGYLERTPFKVNGVTAVKLEKETPRQRRLELDEADRLLAACGPHLRGVVEAALETGCRLGELLGLQWRNVEYAEAKAPDGTTRRVPRSLVLEAVKTKTRRVRRIPISSRLRPILEMRRTGPDGAPQPPSAYVFGNEVGQRMKRVARAWEAAVLKAHGHKPKYETKGARRLTQACREKLRAINLHFHDLRREAGSRWLDAGVPLQTIRDWLGHANISQTSTYLSSTSAGSLDAMRAFEERLGRICNEFATPSQTGDRATPLGEMTTHQNPQEITQQHH
jgi:integrase